MVKEDVMTFIPESRCIAGEDVDPGDPRVLIITDEIGQMNIEETVEETTRHSGTDQGIGTSIIAVLTQKVYEVEGIIPGLNTVIIMMRTM